MIVWGGSNSDYPYYMNSGARYSPAGDFWSPISTTGAPGPRSDHTAIWTGNEMILWGGAYLTGSLNTGGRYDPNSNSWKSTNTSTAPAGRYFHSAVWTGSEMIVFGVSAAGGGRYCAALTAPECSYSVSPVTAGFSSSGGTGNVSISAAAGCAWSASSNANWVTISSGASGSGNGSVSYSVSANPTNSNRTAALIVAGRTVAITQQGSTGACTYSISPTSRNFGSGGGSSTLSISAPAGCSWTATSSASWITLASSSGSGNSTIAYSVSANPKRSARTGSITVGSQILAIKEKGR